MKYMISWFERPQGSPAEYENAQKRILEVFGQWKAPANFKIELFVVRVGEWGGHVLVDCDDPLAIHKFCSTWPAFEMQARPVIAVEDAVRVGDRANSEHSEPYVRLFGQRPKDSEDRFLVAGANLEVRFWSDNSLAIGNVRRERPSTAQTIIVLGG
jgi:hypothetical protein